MSMYVGTYLYFTYCFFNFIDLRILIPFSQYYCSFVTPFVGGLFKYYLQCSFLFMCVFVKMNVKPKLECTLNSSPYRENLQRYTFVILHFDYIIYRAMNVTREDVGVNHPPKKNKNCKKYIIYFIVIIVVSLYK